jgi:hypothetical protein
MSLFAFQMLLDPTGIRVPTIKKGRVPIGTQGQTLSAANASTMKTMMGPMGMGFGMPVGVPAIPTQGVTSMSMPVPMYGVAGVPILSGVPGTPVVAVNGGMGPIPPGSPRISSIKNSSLKVDKGGKVQRSSSAYDLSGEFGQMSMKRTQCNGPTLATPNGQSSRPGSRGVPQEFYKSGPGGVAGTTTLNRRDKKPIF